MSQANDLLNSISEPTAGTVAEGNLIIGRDRYITVPESLKKVAVQFDHNVETVTFDCPRYWDEWDFAKMKIYINYMREDGKIGMHWCQNVVVDSEDSDMIHFDWTISGHVTAVQGHISFLVCVKNVDTEGTEITHWNSELNTEMYVSEGLKCQPTILKHYPDIITQLLVRMETAETNLQTWIAETEKEIADWEAALKKDINTWETNTYKKMDDRMKTAESNTTPAEILRRINSALDTNAETQQQIYDAAADYLRDGIVATGKIEEETNAYLEENLAIIADDLLDITLENTIEKSGVVIPSGEGSMLPVKIMGDSYQKQYSGKNLYPYGDLSGNGGLLTEKPLVLPIGTYKFSMKTNVSSDIVTTIGFLDENKKGIINIGLANSHWYSSRNNITINITSECKYISVYAREEITLSQIQIESGSEMTDYEPYCGGVPSPNPEFPQEIENVGVVRNLLDCSGLPKQTLNGVTVTPIYDENGLLQYLDVDGTSTKEVYYFISRDVDLPIGEYILNGSNLLCVEHKLTWYRDNFKRIDSDKITAFLYLYTGTTFNHEKVYPMIRPATIADPTYHPYIPENKENLLDGVIIESGTIDTVNGTNADNASYNRTILAPMTPGKYVFSCVGIWSQVVRIFFYKNDEYISFYDFKSYSETFEAPKGTTHFRIRYQITEGLTGLIIRPHHIPAQGSQYAVEVKSWDKNLVIQRNSTNIANGVTFEQNGTVIDVYGTTPTANFAYSNPMINSVLPNGKYTIMIDCDNLNDREKIYLSLRTSSSSSTEFKQVYQKDSGYEYVSDGSTLLHVLLQVKEGQTVNSKVKAIVCQKTSSATVYLDEPLRGIGEYRDTICQKDGVWGVERVVEKVVFDGSDDEGWMTSSALSGRYGVALKKKKNGLCLCDCAIYKASSTAPNQCFMNAEGNFYINTEFATLAEWKVFLAENPITVEYALATPTFTPFEDQKQFWKMMAFDGATTISIIDGSDNTVPVGVFRVGRNQDGGDLLTHHSTLNNMEDLEGKITPIPILQADYDKLPESKKKNGIYIITDANVTSFTGNTVRYTGGREGLGDTVDKAISTVDEKVAGITEGITASNGATFRFAFDESTGEYGYIVTDSEGADTFVPFSGKWKKSIVDSLTNTNLGLTYDSTWPEIAAGIATLFPESLNVLAYLGRSSVSLSGKAGSVWNSAEFDITHFNTMIVSASRSVSWNKWHSGWPSQPAAGQAYLVTTKGNINLIGVNSVNISSYTGMAYIRLTAGYTEFMASTDGSGDPETMVELDAYTSASVTKMILQV